MGQLWQSELLFFGTAIAMGIHSGVDIRITKQIGDGVNGWSYWGEPERAPH